MRPLWLLTWYFVMACSIVALSRGSALAEEKATPVIKKYHALLHMPGDKIEKEQEFDLDKPEDVRTLTELLGKGEVAELEREREVNILAINWDLGLWTVVVFVLLLVVLRKLAWKPWLEGIQRRESNIKEALAEAQRARQETAQMRAELQKEMAGAEDRVREVLDEARRDAQRLRDDMVAQARTEIQTERERLQREIAMARDQALQEIWTQAAQLATLISAKAIRRQLNVEDHRRLVDEAITELATVGKNGGVA